MRHLTLAVLAASVMLVPAIRSTAAPKTSNTSTAEQVKLQKEAKITMRDAKAIALKHVKTGSKIDSAELEREHGKLIYSFDVRESGRKDVTEVNVDAMTGKVVAIDHENRAKEAAEKRQEAKEKH